MGGGGSGRYAWRNRGIVEARPCLSVLELQRQKALWPGAVSTSRWSWGSGNEASASLVAKVGSVAIAWRSGSPRFVVVDSFNSALGVLVAVDTTSIATMGADGYLRRWSMDGRFLGVALPGRAYFTGLGCAGSVAVFDQELPSPQFIFQHPTQSSAFLYSPQMVKSPVGGLSFVSYFDPSLGPGCRTCSPTCGLSGFMWLLSPAVGAFYGSSILPPFTVRTQ